MTAIDGTSFLRPAIAGEITPDRPWPTNATQEDLKDCFRFNSEDYDALPELAWETILSIFAQAGQTDQLLDALQGLQIDENDM